MVVPIAANTSSFEQINSASPFIMFGIPGIIITISSAAVLLTMMYRYYSQRRKPRPQIEPVLIMTSTQPMDSV